MTLADRLNQIVAEQKITKREFARRIGISENYKFLKLVFRVVVSGIFEDL